jgi:hypothetical protein
MILNRAESGILPAQSFKKKSFINYYVKLDNNSSEGKGKNKQIPTKNKKTGYCCQA